MLMIVLQICKLRVVQDGDEDSFYLVSAFISCERRENLSQKLHFMQRIMQVWTSLKLAPKDIISIEDAEWANIYNYMLQIIW